MIIKPKRSTIHCKLLDWYLDYKFKTSFKNISYYYHHEPLDPKQFIDHNNSILLIGNHSTWWDGFVGWQFNRHFLKKEYFVMMLESTLQKLSFFRGVGAFSINSANKSVIESLNFSAELLRHNQNLVQFFPQGRLNSIYSDSFEFNKGLELILRKNEKTDILFYAMFMDYGGFEKPYMNVFIEKVDHANGYKLIELQDWYSQFYKQSRDFHCNQFLKINS